MGLSMMSAYERAIAWLAWTVSKLWSSAGSAINSVASVEYTFWRLEETKYVAAIATTTVARISHFRARRIGSGASVLVSMRFESFSPRCGSRPQGLSRRLVADCRNYGIPPA